jgi:hypothetical protein
MGRTVGNKAGSTWQKLCLRNRQSEIWGPKKNPFPNKEETSLFLKLRMITFQIRVVILS